ncbi:MAG: GAF domain-containing protein, partial [Candidatus Methylomirabilia bacterium]
MKHRNALVKCNLTRGSLMVVLGLLIVGLFYLTDLFVMFGLPRLIPRPAALAAMENLHLNYSWIIMLVGTGCICAGFALTNRRLFSLIDRLTRSEAGLGRELTDRKRAEGQAERRRRQAESLAEVGRLISESLDPEQVGQRIVDSVLSLLDAGAASLYRLEPESGDLVMLTASGEAWSSLGRNLVVPKGYGIAGLGVLERRTIVTSDLLADPRIMLTPDMRARVEQVPFRAWVVVPLLIQDRVTGALTVGDQPGRMFDDEDIELARASADQAALTLENARLQAAQVARVRELATLVVVNRAVTSTLDYRGVARAVLEAAQALLPGCVGIVREAVPGTDELRVVETLGVLGGPAPPFHLGEGLAGIATATLAPVVSPDVRQDPRLFNNAWATAEQMVSGVVLPLVHADTFYGTVALFTRTPHEFTTEEVSLLESFAAQAAVAIANARLYAEIKGARDFLQSIAEHSADVIGTTDVHSRFTYLSPAVEEIFGYPAEELLGRPVADFYRGGLEEARAVMQRLRAQGSIRNYETALRAKDGRWVEVSSSISLLRDASGSIIGMMGITRDITERKRAEEELIRSERVWALGEMAAGVAHNFNNLLAVVLGRAQFLLLQLEQGKLGLEEVERNLIIIDRAALNGAATVRRLLEFTRDTARAGEVVAVDVGELLAHTLELVRHRWKDEAEAQGHPVEVVLEPGAVPPAAGNPAELEEVLLCLILNAIDAMPQGGTLTLSSWAEDGRVCLGVKDTGIGIPEEVQSRIFEPFFTT